MTVDVITPALTEPRERAGLEGLDLAALAEDVEAGRLAARLSRTGEGPRPVRVAAFNSYIEDPTWTT